MVRLLRNRITSVKTLLCHFCSYRALFSQPPIMIRSKIVWNTHVDLRTSKHLISHPVRDVDDSFDMCSGCQVRLSTRCQRPLGSSSWLLKIPNVNLTHFWDDMLMSDLCNREDWWSSGWMQVGGVLKLCKMFY